MSWKLKKKAQGLVASEEGVTRKDWGGRVRVALVYPNTYAVGMSNLGFQGVHQMLNAHDDVLCERAFLPDDVDKEDLERSGHTLVSFESGTGVNQYTFVIFVNGDDEMYVTDIRTPTGTFNFDSGMLPESVARDIDAALDTHNLDVLVAPTASPPFVIDEINGNRNLGGSSTPAALAGYPLLSMPARYTPFGLPVNLTLMGRAWSEPTLIRIASALERVLPARRPPRYLPHLSLS